MKSKEEIYEKYGEVSLRFSNYYKFSFGFSGETENGEKVYVSVGGSSDDIYRLDIDSNKEETIKSLEPNYISVIKGKESVVDWVED